MGSKTYEDKISRTQISKFMAHYSQWGVRHAAAKFSGIPMKAITALIERNADFAAEFEEAKQIASADLEMEIIRRGKEGWEENLYLPGKGPMIGPDGKVMTVRRFDPKLLLAAAAANMPEKYGSYAGMATPALPEDLQPDPLPTPDEKGPEKPKL